MSSVVIARHDEIGRAIDEVLRHLPLRELVSGKLVAVKPNETWASPEDTAGVTQPDTLRAVLRAIQGCQPKELVVSGGAGAAETDEVFRAAGPGHRSPRSASTMRPRGRSPDRRHG